MSESIQHTHTLNEYTLDGSRFHKYQKNGKLGCCVWGVAQQVGDRIVAKRKSSSTSLYCKPCAEKVGLI